MEGRTLGHYRVLEKLGEGGMGEVYRAEDTTLKRQVALKVLPEEVAQSREWLERLQREAESLAALNHPNIVTIYSIEEEGGCRFLTMELVEGSSLAELTRESGMVLEEFFELAIPMAEALGEAHGQGVVHRDLKPANVMVDDRGRPKILDFGLAKLRRTVPTVVATEAPTEVMTEPGMVLGTYPYMSPEQAEGKEADHRSDLFSLGIVLYEMITGERPFQGESPVSLISAILKDEPRPLFELRSDLPEGLDPILRRCLEKDPSSRFGSAAGLLEELLTLREDVDAGIEVAARAAALPGFLTDEKTKDREVLVFVGRDKELQQLNEYLTRALDGRGQVVFVSGEAGTGKTALVQEFVARAQADRTDLVAAYGGCCAHTGPGDPYSPVRQVLAQLTGDVEVHWRAGTLTRDQAQRLWGLVPQVATALVETGSDLVGTLIEGEGLLRRAESAATRGTTWLAPLRKIIERKLSLPPDVMLQQSAIFGQCTRFLQEMAEDTPLLLVLEDLHWSDSGSIDLLAHLSRHLAGQRLLIIGSFRSSEIAAERGQGRHPLGAVIHEIERSAGDCEVHLRQDSDEEFVRELIDLEPNRLGEEFRRRLYERTQGHALFTVELLHNLQERGMLVANQSGAWVESPDLAWDVLPAQVDGVIAERIGRLSTDLRDLLRVASVEGADFTAEVLSRVQDSDTRETVTLLSQELERHYRLVGSEGIRRVNSKRLSMYRFLHVLFQKYLYDELDEAERAYLHEDVGAALEELYGEQAEEIAAQLARHFEEAGDVEKAIQYRCLAGQRAVHLAANREAVVHYRRAIELVCSQPSSDERNGVELDLQIAINVPMMMMEGWAAPGVASATSRALALAKGLGGDPRVLTACWFLSSFFAATGEMSKAITHADRMLQLAEELGDELQQAMAHWIAGLYRGLAGLLKPARGHLEKTEAFYVLESHSYLGYLFGLDPGVGAKAHLGWVLTYLGYLDQGRRKSEEGTAIARSLGHPHSLCFALAVAAIADSLRRDWESMRVHSEESLKIAGEYGLPFVVGMALCHKGHALANQGDFPEGIEQIQSGIRLLAQIGSSLNKTLYLQMLAEAYHLAGDSGKALETAEVALKAMKETGELKHELTLPLLKGTIYANSGDFGKAEEWISRGIEAARAREAKLAVLDGSANLARIWMLQGRELEARDLLAPIYDWFTEGFGEVPLREARALLEEIS